MGKTPTLQDIDLGSVRSAADLRKQAEVLAQIADVRMDEYLLVAPEPVKKLHDHGVPKQVIFGVSGSTITLVAAAVLVLYGAQMLSVFISVLQPLYYTYKALETTRKDDDTVWLTYWMVHGVLFMAEHTLLVPVVHFLPGLYFIAKIILQFWMVNFEGSTVIYNRFLAPFLRKHEKELEEKIDLAKEEVKAIAGIAKPTHKPAGEETEAEKEAKADI